jgi:ubiquinone/menaquinone biosynthesis C-methylase UbiE
MEKEFYKTARRALERAGIGPGMEVLDFGARIGHYAIPALDIVGERGRVMALDKNAEALEELRAEAGDRSQLEVVRTEGELEMPFPDGSFDVVLFFDVIQHVQDIPHILDEFKRILRPDGRLLVFIPHEGEIEVVKGSEFRLVKTIEQDMVHWDRVERGTVYVFSPG